MVDARTGWALGTHTVWRTADGGKTWMQIVPPSGFTFSAAAFANGDTVWLGRLAPNGAVSISQSTDAGHHWRMTVVPKVVPFGAAVNGLPLGFTVFDSHRAWLGVSWGSMHANLVTLLRTDDGIHWSIAATNPPISGVLGFRTADDGWAGDVHAGAALLAPSHPDVNHPGLLYVTPDGGRTWHFQPLPIPTGYDGAVLAVPADAPTFSSRDQGIFPVFLGQDKTAAHAQSALEVYRTSDGGHTWTTTPPLSLGTKHFSPGVATFVDGRDGWTVVGKTLAVTRDGGAQWSSFVPRGLRVDANGYDLRTLDFVSPTRGWALIVPPRHPENAALLETRDGGQTWTRLHPTTS